MATSEFDAEIGRCYRNPPPHAFIQPSVFSFRKSTTPSSFPHFFALPRELRDAVYFYALEPPRKEDYIVPIPPDCRPYMWGTQLPILFGGYPFLLDDWSGREEMTRLLRVNRQVYEESRHVLYSQFQFFLLPSVMMENTRMLERMIHGRAARHIRWVGIPIRLTKNGAGYRSTRSNAVDWAAAWAELFEMLPSLQRVELQVRLVLAHAARDEADDDWIVNMLLAWVYPLLQTNVTLVAHPQSARPGLIHEAIRRLPAFANTTHDAQTLIAFTSNSVLR
ncbi:hypothetical protein BJX64DRAFT_291199 [Aspergillus heterothallicus]